MYKIILKKGKDAAVRRFHPWIFSGALPDPVPAEEAGKLAEVFSFEGEYLGTGFCLPGSIAVKLISFEKPQSVSSLWERKIQQAYQIRTKLGLTDHTLTNAYRLINAEGDYFPGLIADYYNGVMVLQEYHSGYRPFYPGIISKLTQLYPDLYAVCLKTAENKGSNDNNAEFLYGAARDVEISENSLKFKIDYLSGQKTGFFLDQRVNRQALMNYANGCEVLNTFCYTGAYSVYALKSMAKRVVQVDSSAKALELADGNIRLNQMDINQVQTVNADVMNYLSAMEESYDLVILDPPAFAKHLSARNNAIRAYARLNEMAIRKIKPGGILFTFSCSQVVNRQLFESAVLAGAINAGRQLRIVERLSQPPDHPVNIFHGEGEYLKGLVLYVE